VNKAFHNQKLSFRWIYTMSMIWLKSMHVSIGNCCPSFCILHFAFTLHPLKSKKHHLTAIILRFVL